MDHSLNDIATQIINAVYAGLKQPANYSMSKEQLKDEFSQGRNRYIETQCASGVFDPESYRQTILKLPVTKRDFTNVAGYTGSRQEYHATIAEVMHFPGLKSVGYVAAMDKVIPFKVCFGNDIFHVLKDKYTGNKPTIWIQDTNLWLLNPPIANITNITFRAILENPRAVNNMVGQKYVDDDPYPMPGSAIDAVRNKIVNDYIRQYRLGSPIPTLLAGDITNIGEPKK